MNITYYFNKPKWNMDMVKRSFSKGIILFNEVPEDIHLIEVVAFISNFKDASTVLNKLREKISFDNFYFNDPLPRISLKNAIYTPQEIIHRVFSDYRKYNQYYGDEAKNMYIYCTELNKNEVGFYLGTSLDPISLEKYNVCDFNIITYNISQIKEFSNCIDTSNESIHLKQQINNWINKTSYVEFCEAIKNRIIGQEGLFQLLAGVYNYLNNIRKNKPVRMNMVLIAPSGSGKTETYRALRDYFKIEIPDLICSLTDMNSIVPAGYKGEQAESILEPLFNQEHNEGIGILFLDEFDKKISPDIGRNGFNFNRATQNALLTLIEGKQITNRAQTIDTTNTLFICLGSFNEQREKKAEIVHHVGFGQKNTGGTTHYTDITREDIIEMGGSFELVGRFSQIINYHSFDKEQVDAVIKKTRKELSKQLGVSIEIDPNAWIELEQKANSEYGCRIFNTYLQEAVMPIYVDWLRLDKAIQKKTKIKVLGERNAVLSGINKN